MPAFTAPVAGDFTHNLGSASVWRGNEDPPAIERVR